MLKLKAHLFYVNFQVVSFWKLVLKKRLILSASINNTHYVMTKEIQIYLVFKRSKSSINVQK